VGTVAIPGAEETAPAAQQLTSQAKSIKEIVDYVTVLGGSVSR